MIGTKTVATVLLLAGLAALAYGLGELSPELVFARGWAALFMIGSFAMVVGTFMFRFWHLGEPSRGCFRWATDATLWDTEAQFLGLSRWRITLGENQGDAFDLGARTQHLVCVVSAFLLALVSIDARALGLFGHFQRGLTAAGSSYCPEPHDAKEAEDDPNAPGCELIRRAYALGYSKSLGDCGGRKKRGQAVVAPCTLRQRDEPFLHYSGRMLASAWTRFHDATGAGYVQKLRREFDERVDRLATFGGTMSQVLASAPHASHHIFTNLPDPGNTFRETTCSDDYRWLAHRPQPGDGPLRASRVFEHILGQLLFEGRYLPSAGYCREYHVHWGTPPDVCEKLAVEPEVVLARTGARAPVKTVLERHRLANEMVAFGGRPPIDPTLFVSFQCYIEGEGPPEQKTVPFLYDGTRFTAEKVKLAPSAPAAPLYSDRYQAVASMLVRGFHYGALLSESGLEHGSARTLERFFGGGDYLFSRLYSLDSVDIYLDPGFIAARPDLLEVYPYQLHLKNFVEVFRRQYARGRGRL